MTHRLPANANPGAGAQFIQAVRSKPGHRGEYILRGTIGRAKVDQLINVILNAYGAEHGVGNQTGADIANREAIRLGVLRDVVGRFAATTPGHILGHDERANTSLETGSPLARATTRCRPVSDLG